ncbi:heterokaryon incompatibility protein-domain-containing protein [Xylogone sp. PMI_703]|nr:heterokaryon incompatibility protein-domain-containing protein [Xylogone sp. PMI_703]
MEPSLLLRPAAKTSLSETRTHLIVRGPRAEGFLTKHVSCSSGNNTQLEYRPLGDRGIRLIQINQGKGSDPITCEIYHTQDLVITDHDFGEHTQCSLNYYALSYAWGDLTNTCEVTVGSKKVSVTKNLRDFLWQAREILSTPLEDRQDVMPLVTSELARDSLNMALFWIDALCINQNDMDEKARQIRRMGDIYNKAREVIVWLGPNDVLSLMPIVGIVWHLRRRTGRLTGKGLLEICQRAWFKRMWVGQEVALAEGEVWMYIGRHCISLRDLETHIGAFALNTLKAGSISQSFVETAFDDLFQMAEIRSMYGEFVGSELKTQSLGRSSYASIATFLETAALISRSRDCSISHDKIYGLLGMTGTSQLPDHLKPDYGKNFEQVYRYPSWVPDFRSLASSRRPKKSNGTVSFVDNGMTMIVEGWQVGVVAETYHGQLGWSRQKGGPKQPISQSVITEFETFLDDVSRIRQAPKSECLMEWIQYNGGGITKEPVNSRRVQKLRAQYFDFVLGNLEMREFDDYVFAGMLDRLRVITRDGIMGEYDRFDQHARSGDLVCLIKGSCRPLILRRQGSLGRYRFISTCLLFSEPRCLYEEGLPAYRPSGKLSKFEII